MTAAPTPAGLRAGAAPGPAPWDDRPVREDRRRWLPIGVILLVAAMLVALATWRYQQDKQDEARAADWRGTIRAERVSASLEDTLAAALLQIDALHALAGLLTEARTGGDIAAEARLRGLLNAAALAPGSNIAQVAAILPDGRMLWSNLGWEHPDVDVADRDYYQALVRDPSLADFMGRTVQGRISGEWTMQAARSLRGPAGELVAITLVSLRTGYFGALSERLGLGPNDFASVLRGDGTVLMRSDNAHLGEIAPGFTPGEHMAPNNAPLAADTNHFGAGAHYTVQRAISGTPLFLRLGVSQPEVAAQMSSDARSRWISVLLLYGAIGLTAAAAVAVVEAVRRSRFESYRRAAMAANAAWFSEVLDGINEGVSVLDGVEAGAVTAAYMNPAGERIVSRSMDKAGGAAWLKFVHPDDQPKLAERLARASRGESLETTEYRLLGEDGRLAWVRINSALVARPGGGSGWRLISVFRDVTEERARETALVEAHAANERILRTVPGVFYELAQGPEDPIPRCVFVSESVTRVIGATAAEAIKPGFLVSRVKGDLPALRAAALAAVPFGEVGTAEYAATFDGREMWLRDSLREASAPPGWRRVVGFLADATAEHQAQQAREAAEAELRRLNWALTAQADSMATLMRSGSVAEMMQRVCDVITEKPVYMLAAVGMADAPDKKIRFLAWAGDAPEYMRGMELSWDEDLSAGQGPAGRCIRSGVPVVVADTELDPSFAPWRERARQHGVRSTLSVPLRFRGRTAGLLGVWAGTTDVFGPDVLAVFGRLAEEIAFAMTLEEERALLRAAEERLRDAVQLGPGLLYRARVEGGAVEVLDVFGDPARVTAGLIDEAGGAITFRCLLNHAQRLAALEAEPAADAVTDEYPVADVSGGMRWLRNVFREFGRTAGGVEFVGYISEVTQEKREQLRRQQESTLMTLGEMATGMAHELTQPLASISAAAQTASLLLEREQVHSPKLQNKLEKIFDQAMRAGKLVDHMRAFARNEQAPPEPIRWSTALASAVEILRAKLHECELRDEVPADIAPVMGSLIPMEQILINLVANAVDAYGPVSAAAQVCPVVRVSAHVDGGEVVLSVADHAGGIAPEVQARMFEPFYTTKPVGKGTGLGLTLVFTTVAAMGGRLTCHNADGGAVFEVRLKAAPAELEEACAA